MPTFRWPDTAYLPASKMLPVDRVPRHAGLLDVVRVLHLVWWQDRALEAENFCLRFLGGREDDCALDREAILDVDARENQPGVFGEAHV